MRSRAARWRGRFLGGALALLAGFLLVLVRVFVAEDETRRAESEGQRAALEAWATSTLTRALDDEWRRGVALMEPALADPLLDDERLLLVVDGERLLPRRVGGGDVSGVVDAMNELIDPRADDPDDSPRGERRRFVFALAKALSTSDTRGVEQAVRGLLSHRRAFVLAPRDDLSTLLAMVTLLQLHTKPARALLEGVLREGFGPGDVGLQRLVLLTASKLSRDELARLCDVVTRQSVAAKLPARDFAARCEALLRPPPEAPRGVSSALELRGEYLVKGGAELRGVRVDLERFERDLQRAMEEQHLAAPGDRLTFSADDGRVDGLPVHLDGPRWHEAAASRREALLLKLTLLGLAFLLGAGLVGLAVVLQRREQALLDVRSELVSTVSHELRTPLASLRVMAETLERKTAGLAEVKDWPARIVGEVDGLSALVENILSFNRLDRGRDLFHLQPLALDEVRGWLGKEPGVQLSFEGLEGVSVHGDAAWLELALVNLVRNAKKYNARDPVTVSVRASVDGERVHLDVTDNGVGLAPEHHESVFEAFHRLRDGRGRGGGGSGLGLAIVRRVARGHGGDVKVCDSSPEGTTFRLTLRRG